MEKIQKELFGYKRQDVNQLIQETVEKTEDLLERINVQEEQIETLQKQIIHYQKSEANLRTFLENSAGNPIKIKEDAQIEANRIIQEARENADRIIKDAMERSEELETKMKNIKQELRRFKYQLRAIAEQQTDIVEQIGDLEIEK